MKNIIYAPIISLIMIIISSCGIFEPRDNEAPENPAEWIDYPINKDQVLQNIKFSYKYPENQNKYKNMFTEDFTFEFASQDISEHSTPYNLNLQEEESVIFNMHKIMSDYNQIVRIDSLNSISGQSDIIDTASATLYRNYYIQVFDKNSNVLQREYRGKAQFNLIQDPESSLWKIESWIDYRTLTNQTWGLLKNEYLF